MDGDRHDFQLRAYQHHHRMQRLSRGRGEGGEIFRMPWKCEASTIEHGFGDRVGDDGPGDALPRQLNGALDRLFHRRHRGLAGMAGNHLATNPHRQHGEGVAKDGRRFARIVELADRHLEAQRPGARGDNIRIAEQDERRNCLALPCLPGKQRDIGPDPGGIAKGEG